MKSLKLFLVAFATIAISSLYACGGGSGEEATTDSTAVSTEPAVEQTVDSTAAGETK
jgi:hypothetical protein